MRFKKFKEFASQRGDTIVEVLLAMAVVGLVLGVAYGITNRSVAIGRSAQERSEALKLAETQLELLKEYISQENIETNVMQKLDTALSLSPPNDSACLVINSSNLIEVRQVEDSLGPTVDDCEFGLFQVSTSCISGLPNANAGVIALGNTCQAPASAADRKIIVRVIWDRVGGGLRDDGSGNLEPVRDNLDLYFRYGG